jgi:hypothetical protein
MLKKCKRCRSIFTKHKKEKWAICPRCRGHCSRCDTVLTEPDKRYLCKLCVNEIAQYTVKERKRDCALLRTYGITLTEYRNLLDAQNGVCWICGRSPKTVSLSVDHRHEKGEKRKDPKLIRDQIRGILCWRCNNAIAKFDDNTEYLRRAAEYLETTPAQQVLTCRTSKTREEKK